MADAAKLARDLFQLARRCVHDYGVNAVLFCPVLPRGPGRFRAKTLDFLATAELFNASLKHLCATENSMAVVRHQRILTKLPSLLLVWVHLSDAGLKRYYFSLHRAIVAGLK